MAETYYTLCFLTGVFTGVFTGMFIRTIRLCPRNNLDSVVDLRAVMYLTDKINYETHMLNYYTKIKNSMQRKKVC